MLKEYGEFKSKATAMAKIVSTIKEYLKEQGEEE